MSERLNPTSGRPPDLVSRTGGDSGRSPRDALSLERWQKAVLFGAAAAGAVLAAAALLWRQLDGLAVLGLVAAAGLLTLFGVAGQIPWTLWAQFRQEADQQLAEVVTMKQRLGAEVALQTLSAVVANHNALFGGPRMVAAPSPSPSGFTWTAEVYPGGEALQIQPGSESEQQPLRNTEVLPRVRVLYVPADIALVDALPIGVLRERGASHRDGLLIMDAHEPPRSEDLRQLLVLAGYRQLIDEAAPSESPRFVRQMPVRVAGPTFTQLDRALFARPNSMIGHVGKNELSSSMQAPLRYESSAEVFTDGQHYAYHVNDRG